MLAGAERDGKPGDNKKDHPCNTYLHQLFQVLVVCVVPHEGIVAELPFFEPLRKVLFALTCPQAVCNIVLRLLQGEPPEVIAYIVVITHFAHGSNIPQVVKLLHSRMERQHRSGCHNAHDEYADTIPPVMAFCQVIHAPNDCHSHHTDDGLTGAGQQNTAQHYRYGCHPFPFLLPPDLYRRYGTRYFYGT